MTLKLERQKIIRLITNHFGPFPKQLPAATGVIEGMVHVIQMMNGGRKK